MTNLMLRIAVVLAMLCASAAAAPDAAAIKKASAHFKLGQEFFKSRQWDRAIVEYQAALDLTGEPLLVFNIALAHDRAGRAEEALAGFQRYLDLASDGPVADEAREDVTRLVPIVDKLHADRAAEEARKAKLADQARTDAARQADAAKQAEAEKVRRIELAGRADAVARHGRIQRWEGIAIASAGVILAGIGVKFGLDARSIADELGHHQGAWTDADIARDGEGSSAGKKSVVLTGLGAAAIAFGGVLYVIGRGSDRRAEQMRLGVAPTPHGGSVSLSFGF
jgi:tetratricopeptide (TPR) repeat protein